MTATAIILGLLLLTALVAVEIYARRNAALETLVATRTAERDEERRANRNLLETAAHDSRALNASRVALSNALQDLADAKYNEVLANQALDSLRKELELERSRAVGGELPEAHREVEP